MSVGGFQIVSALSLFPRDEALKGGDGQVERVQTSARFQHHKLHVLHMQEFAAPIICSAAWVFLTLETPVSKKWQQKKVG